MPAKVKGSCSICSSEHSTEYAGLIKNGLNSSQLNAAAARYNEGWSRPTWYRHFDHVRVEVPKIREHGGGNPNVVAPMPSKALTITKSSNQEFLETIRDIGYSKAIENPAMVTMEQAIKAASILEGRKDRDAGQLKVMIGVFTGRMPEVQVIEGEATEVSN